MKKFALTAAIVVLVAEVASAHIRIAPTESTVGAREKYTMRVPNEKKGWPGKIQPYEFVEFGMLAINPKQGANLTWKFIQYYDDGTKEEFTGPVGSRLPAPVVTLKPATTAP